MLAVLPLIVAIANIIVQLIKLAQAHEMEKAAHPSAPALPAHITSSLEQAKTTLEQAHQDLGAYIEQRKQEVQGA